MYNNVVINLGSKCNAACAHCCFSCSPTSSESMDHDYIRQLVYDLASNNNIKVISFTGGEIFLNYSFLKELLETIKPFSKIVTLISNGFWGMSRKNTINYFEDMEYYNVTNLTISYDEFHEPYVKLDSIKNILECSRDFPNTKVSLNMAVTKNKMSNHILERLGDSLLGIKVTKFPLMPVGEAKNEDTEAIHHIYNLSNERSLHCPGFEIVYHFDGQIYPCCSPAIFETKLHLRESSNQSFERTVEKINSNILFYIMRKEGFKWFIDIIQNNMEFKHIKIPEQFSSICTICNLIFKDEENIRLLTPYMMEYYEGVS